MANGHLRFKIPPLPRGHFNFDGLPFTQSGPHKVQVAPHEFASALRNVSLKDALENVASRNLVVFPSVVDKDLVKANTKIGVELNQGFKSNESKIKSVAFAANKVSVFINNLFNARKPAGTNITVSAGVDDDGNVIGYDVGELDNIHTTPPYDLSCFMRRFFPPLPPQCLEIRHKPVVVDLPPTSPPRTEQEQTEFDAMTAFEQLVQTKGCLEVFEWQDLDNDTPVYKTADLQEQLATLQEDTEYSKVSARCSNLIEEPDTRMGVFPHGSNHCEEPL